jgi:hypothetical protein
MSTHSRPNAPSAATVLPWMLDLAIWVVARSLNMPEPLVHNTGVFVFAHVQAAETRAAKTLCPIRLLRQLVAWFR